MEIVVNGKARSVEDGITVAGVLDHLGVISAHIAVEVNLELVTRDKHGHVILNEGDQMEVVTLVGGG